MEHGEALLAEQQERARPLAAEMDSLAKRVIEVSGKIAASEAMTMRVPHASHPGDERRVSSPRSDGFARAAEELL